MGCRQRETPSPVSDGDTGRRLAGMLSGPAKVEMAPEDSLVLGGPSLSQVDTGTSSQ